MLILGIGNKESGFTLLEVVAVLILIGFISALAVPNFFNSEEKAMVDKVGALLQNDLNQVKAEAIIGQTGTSLNFEENGYSFKIGTTQISRRLDRLKLSNLAATSVVVTEENQEVSVESNERKLNDKLDIYFNKEGYCAPQQIRWETVHYQGSINLKEDGTVGWVYEPK